MIDIWILSILESCTFCDSESKETDINRLWLNSTIAQILPVLMQTLV